MLEDLGGVIWVEDLLTFEEGPLRKCSVFFENLPSKMIGLSKDLSFRSSSKVSMLRATCSVFVVRWA